MGYPSKPRDPELSPADRGFRDWPQEEPAPAKDTRRSARGFLDAR